ncbi:MAG: FIG002343: hypothetical protein [uncultured Rubrobacteraceae bacterium]|uniref:DUF58 domain-containing protein n=1 Tax=uncultured Rubrobacteraceae bacterium TaxID=349277 RepID=A0A6J4QZ91_9ACTN|nr:MAG: FIG002343: hypothetical protein [uncultured Rubrobacteraceae bacterium]
MRRIFARALRAFRGRKLRVRPTGRGWQALFFGVLSLVVARLIGTTQIYQLGYALLALMLAALVLGFWSSRGLSYSRRLPGGERPTAGRETGAELLVSNSSRSASPRVEVSDRLPKPRFFELPSVDGGETGKIRVRVSFPKRGVYNLGPAEVKTKDPFGLLRFIRRFPEPTEVVVYPEVHALPGFPLRGSGADAGVRGAFSQRGDEFSGLREYRRGDERRHIHWKSVARTGELVVREFSANAPRRYAVVLDLQRAGLRGSVAESEDAISAGASVLSHLAFEGLPSKLLLSDAERGGTGFGSGEGTYRAAMRLLATADADGNQSLDEYLDGVPRGELGEGVILISRSIGEGLARSVTRLRSFGLSVLVVAVAVHTYRGSRGGGEGREAAFLAEVRRLEVAGATVRVLRREGGVRALGGVFGSTGGTGLGSTTSRGAV